MLGRSCFCGSNGTPVALTWLGTTAWISFVDCVLKEIALSACSTYIYTCTSAQRAACWIGSSLPCLRAGTCI